MSNKPTIKRKATDSTIQTAPIKRTKAPVKPKAKGSDIDDIFNTISTKSSKPVTSKSTDHLNDDKPTSSLSKPTKTSSSARKPAKQPKPITEPKPTSQHSVIPEDDFGFTRSSQHQQQAKSAAAVSRSAGDLKIYDIDSLGMGKGGDTSLCPFDCECCV